MTAIAPKLRTAYSRVLAKSRHQVVMEHRTWGVEDSQDQTAQWTVAATDYVTGIISKVSRRNEKSEGFYSATILTTLLEPLSYTPDVRTIVTVDGSDIFRVVNVNTIEGVLVQLELRGEAKAAAVAADTVAPRFTAQSATLASATSVSYTGTTNEAAHHRYRYRKKFASWTTSAWVTGPGYTTSHSGTIAGLDSGDYEFAIQARDAAGNVGSWFDMGDVNVPGVPS